VESGHAGLVCNEAVLGALDDLLGRGTCDHEGLGARSESFGVPDPRELAEARDAEEVWFDDLVRRLRSRSTRRAAAIRRKAESSGKPALPIPQLPDQVSPD